MLHVKPGSEFDAAVARSLPVIDAEVSRLRPQLSPKEVQEAQEYLDAFRDHATNTFYRRSVGCPGRIRLSWAATGSSYRFITMDFPAGCLPLRMTAALIGISASR